MKEKIYTIPVNEAYESNCTCPLCQLECQLEKEGIEYALGAAMMEPDYRVESNEKGYCKKHFSMLFAHPNKLSLSLVLDTHLAEVRKNLNTYKKRALSLGTEKSGLFQKSDAGAFSVQFSEVLSQTEDICIICDKIAHTMERYIDVLFYLWDKDPAFQEKFRQKPDLCRPHLKTLISAAPKYLPKQKAGKFIAELFEMVEKSLSDLQEDIHKFTLKFDYRNKDMEWGTAKDAPIRTVERLSGAILKINPEKE